MNLLDNPVQVLANCYAEILTVLPDFTEARLNLKRYRETGEECYSNVFRKPRVSDVEVFAMFGQTWGSTSLGFSGIGGAAMTTAYTVVLHCARANRYFVFFDGSFCYSVSDRDENFVVAVRNHNIPSERDAKTMFSDSFRSTTY